MAAVSSRLSPFPARVGGGGGAALLAEATLWLDARYSVAGEQSAVNQGTGGSALNATYGSTASADTNDPLWLGHDGVNYVYNPNTSNASLTVPDNANLHPTTSFSIRTAVAPDDWTPATTQRLAGHYKATGNQRSYELHLSTGGALAVALSTDGITPVTIISSANPTVADGGILAVRSDWTVSPAEVKFYTKATTEATAYADCASDADWTQLGITRTTSVPSTALFDSTSTYGIGGDDAGGMNGKIHANVLIVDGTTRVQFNAATDITSSNATSFTATSGQTVTVVRAFSGRKTALVTRPVWLFGTDDYMEIADNALLDFGASDSFTVVWVGRQWNTPPSGGRMVSKANSGTITGYHVAANSTTLTPLISVGDGVTNRGLSPTAVVQGALSVVGGVVDRTAETLTAFTNNTFSVTGSTAGIGSLANAYPLRIGSRGDAAGSYQDMELVAVAVFRRALTAAELALINTHYGTV